MFRTSRSRVGASIAVALLTLGLQLDTAEAQSGLSVVSVRPAAHAMRASTGAGITIEFDRPIDRGSVDGASFWAFGRWSGAAPGRFRFGDGDRTVTLDPERRFSAGEMVLVVLSRDLRGADGSTLRPGGYSFQFWTRAAATGFNLRETQRFSTRTAVGVSTRPYGGLGADVDGDGQLDLTVVNEDTNDLRTYRNVGGALVESPIDPMPNVGNVPSPNETADFDRDGVVDIVVANTRGASVSILLGRGDGTFGSDQRIGVGGQPRGVTVLDADGDGDLDIAVATFVDGRVTLLFNDGGGRFGSPRSFGTGGGERAIAAGDMNDDGLLDLVVGTQNSEEIQVYTNRGDGRFERTGTASSGGAVWMIVLGDVDRDGAEDVAVVNGRSNGAALVRGDGAGGLGETTPLATDPFPLATDLADLDGDGDLDWVTSSFDGDWLVFENDGSGAFTERLRIAAPDAASCSIPMDLDGDGALDLVLIDELADEVIVMTSAASGGGGSGGGGGPSGATFESDFESGTLDDWARARGEVAVVSPGLRGSGFALQIGAGGPPAYVESRVPNRETSWNVSFDLDLRDLDLTTGELEILHLAARAPRAKLVLTRNGTAHQVELLIREGPGYRSVGSTPIPSSRTIELGVEWSNASAPGSADGRAALLRRGRVRAEMTDLANAGQVINRVRLGAPGGGAGAGALRFDRYESHP